jgi:hypothetical protein
MKIVETMLRGRIAQDQQAATPRRDDDDGHERAFGRLLLRSAPTGRSPTAGAAVTVSR